MDSEYKRLNVGCGHTILPGWLNLDAADLPGINIRFDLEHCRNEKIPLPDNSIDEFLLSHIIEHIKDPLAMMQELYRLAKPNAKCIVRVPYGSSDDAWTDPTHVRPYFPSSFNYFNQLSYWRADYGYRGDWKAEKIELYMKKAEYGHLNNDQIAATLNHSRNAVVEMAVLLIAVKPARVPQGQFQSSLNFSIVWV